jgi:hypothetical protein
MLCPLACWRSITSRQYRCRSVLLVITIAEPSEYLLELTQAFSLPRHARLAIH